MDFRGRVTRASKKNFLLVDARHNPDAAYHDEPGKAAVVGPDAPVLLLFGKVQKDRFSLDFGSPFTPVSAIFVALSTFANKLAVA